MDSSSVVETDRRAEWPPRPESVTAARDFVTGVLSDWDLRPLLDTAALVTSELVANVVLHAGTAFSLSVLRLPDGVLLRINDACSALPVPQPGGVMAATGRGLHLLESVCEGWGAVPDGHGGKAVWALLRCDGPRGDLRLV